jgi:hypothetical protein
MDVFDGIGHFSSGISLILEIMSFFISFLGHLLGLVP